MDKEQDKEQSQKKFKKGWYELSFNLRLSESKSAEELEIELIRSLSKALGLLGFDLISSVFLKWVDEFEKD